MPETLAVGGRSVQLEETSPAFGIRHANLHGLIDSAGPRRECGLEEIFRDLIDMPATVTVAADQITVRFHRRAHLPIIVDSGMLDSPVSVPWWNGAALRLMA